MSFTREEIDTLLLRMSEGRHNRSWERKQQPKRKLDYQILPMYNESMSRVELLAKAMNGTVIEDQGYRGVIYIEERKEFIRYHSAHGVHAVVRTPKVWRVTRTILAPDEIRPFLEELGLVPKIISVGKPIELLAKACNGSVVVSFQTGGGVLKDSKGVYWRFSNVTGLDIVDYIVSKWRSVRHVATRIEVLRALQDGTAAQLFNKEEVTV